MTCPNQESECCHRVTIWGQDTLTDNPDGTVTVRSIGKHLCCFCGESKMYVVEETFTRKKHGPYRRKDAA